jgi:two-component system, chemotaxis family, response regulator WspF
LLELRQSGWHTIAQDEATSVVYGMPQAASQLGAAVEVLAIGEIAASAARQINRF